MSRPVKRLLMLIGCMVLVASRWIGWHLLLIEAATRHVTWQTQEGGLTLSQFPLKDQAAIYVGSDYVSGATHTEVVANPV